MSTIVFAVDPMMKSLADARAELGRFGSSGPKKSVQASFVTFCVIDPPQKGRSAQRTQATISTTLACKTFQP